MPYLVQQEVKPDEWETLYSEEDALKADLLMWGLMKAYPRYLKSQHVGYVSGYRVAWREPPAAASTGMEGGER